MTAHKSRGLSLRLALLVVGAALTGVVIGSPGVGAVVSAIWLALNLFWLVRRTQVMLGLAAGLGGWATAVRLLVLAAGLWLLMANGVATGLDVLIAITWMYPGLALSFLIRKDRTVKDDR